MTGNGAVPGKLIAVEGLDGSGKSTQIHLVHEWLQGPGHRVTFSEWNSGEIVREVMKRGKKRQLRAAFEKLEKLCEFERVNGNRSIMAIHRELKAGVQEVLDRAQGAGRGRQEREPCGTGGR